jgi:hypothetical protein
MIQMCIQLTKIATSRGLSMLEMYGLAAVFFQETRKGRSTWNEDDWMWFDPDRGIARAVRIVWNAGRERLSNRAAEHADCRTDRCAPTGPA